MTRLNEHWPAIRAALLTVMVFHGVLLGLPIPALDEERLERPYWWPLVQTVQRLTGENLEATQQRIVRSSEQLTALQGRVTSPLAWLYRGLRAGQSWNMFAGAAKRSFSLRLEMRRDGHDDFETLYAVHDPQARFEAERIEYRRIHAAYIVFDAHPPGPYHAMCRWLAKRVFYTYDDAMEVRVRMRSLNHLSLAERRASGQDGDWAHGYRLTRQRFLEDVRSLHD